MAKVLFVFQRHGIALCLDDYNFAFDVALLVYGHWGGIFGYASLHHPLLAIYRDPICDLFKTRH